MVQETDVKPNNILGGRAGPKSVKEALSSNPKWQPSLVRVIAKIKTLGLDPLEKICMRPWMLDKREYPHLACGFRAALLSSRGPTVFHKMWHVFFCCTRSPSCMNANAKLTIKQANFRIFLVQNAQLILDSAASAFLRSRQVWKRRRRHYLWIPRRSYYDLMEEEELKMFPKSVEAFIRQIFLEEDAIKFRSSSSSYRAVAVAVAEEEGQRKLTLSPSVLNDERFLSALVRGKDMVATLRFWHTTTTRNSTSLDMDRLLSLAIARLDWLNNDNVCKHSTRQELLCSSCQELPIFINELLSFVGVCEKVRVEEVRVEEQSEKFSRTTTLEEKLLAHWWLPFQYEPLMQVVYSFVRADLLDPFCKRKFNFCTVLTLVEWCSTSSLHNTDLAQACRAREQHIRSCMSYLVACLPCLDVATIVYAFLHGHLPRPERKFNY